MEDDSMAITNELPDELEMKIREQAASGNVDAVRRLLIEALNPTVDALMRRHAAAELSDEEFEMLIDQMTDLFTAYVGADRPPLSDDAVSRAGLYEGHL
jgi:hypothetical protein